MRILTFDIGATEIKYGICNEKLELSDIKSIPTEAQNGGNAIIDKVIGIINSFDNIDKIAIATAGQVDSDKGEIVYSTGNIPNYTGCKIKETIESQTGIEAVVENDVNAAAIGEAVLGAGKSESSFICLTYGTGIGGAIYSNGEIFKGASYSAGEFGHIITHAGGKACTCGGRGCYEAYASTSALVKMTSKSNAKEIFADDTYKAEIDNWIDEIIYGLISIIYTFNPSLIILGGGVMAQNYITEEINKRIYPQLMDSFRNVKIAKAQLGNTAGMIGVASKVLNK